MKRILIVDDQKSWREFHSNVLKNILDEKIDITIEDSAENAYAKLIENIKTPYDVLITDMQMENNYEPLMAGEWLIEQVQSLSSYENTDIIIISASPKIRYIAESYGVKYIPKSVAAIDKNAYKNLF